jgi:predicted nucleic-acid-binding protein
MYLADTNILLRFLLANDPAYPTIPQAVRILKIQREQIVTTSQKILLNSGMSALVQRRHAAV